MAAESATVLSEGGKLLVEPYIEDLPELFVSYFKQILQVGYEIPRLEYYMSQGKQCPAILPHIFRFSSKLQRTRRIYLYVTKYCWS